MFPLEVSVQSQYFPSPDVAYAAAVASIVASIASLISAGNTLACSIDRISFPLVLIIFLTKIQNTEKLKRWCRNKSFCSKVVVFLVETKTDDFLVISYFCGGVAFSIFSWFLFFTSSLPPSPLPSPSRPCLPEKKKKKHVRRARALQIEPSSLIRALFWV